jgi:hypothetical protein
MPLNAAPALGGLPLAAAANVTALTDGWGSCFASTSAPQPWVSPAPPGAAAAAPPHPVCTSAGGGALVGYAVTRLALGLALLVFISRRRAAAAAAAALTCAAPLGNILCLYVLPAIGLSHGSPTALQRLTNGSLTALQRYALPAIGLGLWPGARTMHAAVAATGAALALLGLVVIEAPEAAAAARRFHGARLRAAEEAERARRRLVEPAPETPRGTEDSSKYPYNCPLCMMYFEQVGYGWRRLRLACWFRLRLCSSSWSVVGALSVYANGCRLGLSVGALSRCRQHTVRMTDGGAVRCGAVRRGVARNPASTNFWPDLEPPPPSLPPLAPSPGPRHALLPQLHLP